MTGARLERWDGRRFVPCAEHDDAEPAALTCALSATELARAELARQHRFRVVPKGENGTDADGARLAVAAAELEVRYRLAGP
jgi:hypothetical protein